MTLTACLKGNIFPGILAWYVSRFPCSQYSITMMIKSLAVWKKTYSWIRIRSERCWDDSIFSWYRSPGRCISARRVSSWCAAYWWSWLRNKPRWSLSVNRVTIPGENNLSKSTFPNRLDDLVVFALEGLSHVLKSPFVTPHLVHNLNINKYHPPRSPSFSHYKIQLLKRTKLTLFQFLFLC